jgi:hypothetical protein
MRLTKSSSRQSQIVPSVLALALCVAAGCKVSTHGLGAGSSNPTSNGGQVCASGSGDLSGSNGDVQLHLCTDWTCTKGTSESGACVTCTAPQPSGTPIPPGIYNCSTEEGGLYCPPGTGGGSAGWSCVATASSLSCGPVGGCSSDCIPGTEGCPSGSGGSGDCIPGTEGCASGSGGSGGCVPGTEGCASGSGGSSGKGGSGGSGDCVPGTEGCTGGSGGAGGSGGPCTLTQGYWKNHPEAWPVTSLTIGGVTYSQSDLLAIFAMDPGGDASLILAHQLIAALLNQAAAANPPAAVTLALGNAQAWMAANKDADGTLPYGTPPGSAAANAATALASTLDNFNSGLAGVPHCQ